MDSGTNLARFCVHIDDSFAFIGPTIGAQVMRYMIASAVFAFHQMFERQRIVRAAFVRPAVRVPLLWERTHSNAPYKLVQMLEHLARASKH